MKIQVLEVTPRSGVSKTSGKPYAFQVCKCVITGPEGIEVGEIVLFDCPEPVLPGEYFPEYEIKKDMAGRLQGIIKRLNPAKSSSTAQAAAK